MVSKFTDKLDDLEGLKPKIIHFEIKKMKNQIFFTNNLHLTLPTLPTLPTHNLIHYLPYNYILYLIQFIERKLIISIKMKIISIN